MAVMICSMTAAAQTVGVAVLTHNNENTMFYGNTALQQAVEAAVEGDVITLSPGTFVGLDRFSKSGLTIIGSGMAEGPSQTILNDISPRPQDNEEKFLKITLKNLYLAHSVSFGGGSYEMYLEKCQFPWGLDCHTDESENKDIEIINCISLYRNNFTNCNLKALNCVLGGLNLGGGTSREKVLTNCIISGNPDPAKGGAIHNCIIIDESVSALGVSLRATNCKAIVANNGDYFRTQSYSNEEFPIDFQAFVEGSFYELLPELTTTWVDENGEQIGLYGGPEPFSALPDAPRFTKFNVPSRTDAEGHLKVEIEVAIPEK